MTQIRALRLLAICTLCAARARVLAIGVVFVAGAVLLCPRQAVAEDVEVPVSLQVALVSRVAAYDRNLQHRARGRVLIWVVVLRGDADSERIAGQLHAAFAGLPNIAGLPTTVRTVEYVSPDLLLERCKRDVPTLLYLSAGLSTKATAIAKAVDGLSLLSIAAVPRYVDDGAAILGIESRSGKPSLVVHIGLARRHQVAFKPELLKLARVIR